MTADDFKEACGMHE